MEKIITNGMGAALAVLLAKYFREKYGIAFIEAEIAALAVALYGAFVVVEHAVRGTFDALKCLVDRLLPPKPAPVAPGPSEPTSAPQP